MTATEPDPMSEFDLVISGGRVIDPSQSIDRITDVAFKNGKVAAVGDGLAAKAAHVEDAKDRIVEILRELGEFSFALGAHNETLNELIEATIEAEREEIEARISEAKKENRS